MKRLITSCLTGMALTAIAACGDDDPEPTMKFGNGVNDVRQSCDIRSTWVRTEQNKCSLCEAGVINAVCECEELKAFSGACLDQANAAKAACNDNIVLCVSQCRSDCTCIDQCYANDAGCKKAAAARDGCIAEACASRCK